MLLIVCEFLLILFAISTILFVIGALWKIAIDETIRTLREKRKASDETES